jgi:putative addiction module component (TIGR02574 family)
MDMDFENPALQTILRLPTEDRIQAAQMILKSLDQPEDAPLSDEMIALLDAQLEDFRRNPEAGEDWETVRASIESRL